MDIRKNRNAVSAQMERKVGIFLIVAFIGALATVAYIISREEIFTQRTSIYFTTNTADDIYKGQAVKMSGFHIGEVKNIALYGNARVKVELSILTQYMHLVRKDSWAVLLSQKLVGDSVIEITPGIEEEKQIDKGGEINFQRPKAIDQMAAEIKDEVMALMKDFKKLLAYINDPKGDVKMAIHHLNLVSKEAVTTVERLNTVIERLDTAISHTDHNLAATLKETRTLMTSARQTVTLAANTVQIVNKDLPLMLGSAGRSLDNTVRITGDIKALTPRLPSLMDAGMDVLSDTKEITGSLKQIWPVRLYIEGPVEKSIKVDLYD